MKFATVALITALPAIVVISPARAQTTTTTSTGSVGCAALTQAAANGLTARVAADDQTINAPMSVTSMTCLSNFFNGVGLNVITNLLNPSNLLQAVEGQICNLVKSEWSSLVGSSQCGLTLTGFNFGFGGLGGGLSCPKLTFGGGGPPIGTLGLGLSSGSGLYIRGVTMPPSGYTPPANLQPGVF